MIGRFWFVVRFCSVYTSAVVQLKKDLAGVKVSLKYLGSVQKPKRMVVT